MNKTRIVGWLVAGTVAVAWLATGLARRGDAPNVSDAPDESADTRGVGGVAECKHESAKPAPTNVVAVAVAEPLPKPEPARKVARREVNQRDWEPK